MTHSALGRDARRLALVVSLAVSAAAGLLWAQSSVTLGAPSPNAGQPGIQVINLTGSGFPSGTIQPSAVTVTVRPAGSASGATGTTTATAVTTIAGTTRRLTFTIPTAIAVASPTPYNVTIQGQTTTGVSFLSTNAAALTVNPPSQIASLVPASANQATSVTVAITTTFTNFVQGATQASFGPGT